MLEVVMKIFEDNSNFYLLFKAFLMMSSFRY